jgi:hypothetical protein
MKNRHFGDVCVEIDNGEASVFINGRSILSLRAADELIEDLRSATAWVRDQQRREKEEQDTPMLPL